MSRRYWMLLTVGLLWSPLAGAEITVYQGARARATAPLSQGEAGPLRWVIRALEPATAEVKTEGGVGWYFTACPNVEIRLFNRGQAALRVEGLTLAEVENVSQGDARPRPPLRLPPGGSWAFEIWPVDDNRPIAFTLRGRVVGGAEFESRLSVDAVHPAAAAGEAPTRTISMEAALALASEGVSLEAEVDHRDHYAAQRAADRARADEAAAQAERRRRERAEREDARRSRRRQSEQRAQADYTARVAQAEARRRAEAVHRQQLAAIQDRARRGRVTPRPPSPSLAPQGGAGARLGGAEPPAAAARREAETKRSAQAHDAARRRADEAARQRRSFCQIAGGMTNMPLRFSQSDLKETGPIRWIETRWETQAFIADDRDAGCKEALKDASNLHSDACRREFMDPVYRHQPAYREGECVCKDLEHWKGKYKCKAKALVPCKETLFSRYMKAQRDAVLKLLVDEIAQYLSVQSGVESLLSQGAHLPKGVRLVRSVDRWAGQFHSLKTRLEDVQKPSREAFTRVVHSLTAMHRKVEQNQRALQRLCRP